MTGIVCYQERTYSKCANILLVFFKAYRNSAVPVFRLYNQEVEERDSFTYLGMLFDKHMNLHHAATQRVAETIVMLQKLRRPNLTGIHAS